MTARFRGQVGQILDAALREARLSPPICDQLRGHLEGHSSIDPDLVGRLYEQSLAGDCGSRRQSGSFFTPVYLVDFVVERTLGPIVEGLCWEQICKLRILDPSCGAGAFLLGVLRYLETRCLRLGAPAGVRLRRRLAGCLVGIDLDPGALDACRVALHLAVGTSVQRPPNVQLVCGDALLPETEVGAVDAIVGNPPWGQKGLRIDESLKRRYRELFSCSSGVWDPFKLFVERCHQILAPGGRWGLVLPDILLLKNLQNVRDLILEGSALSDIAHCGQAFSGVNIDTIAVCGNRVSRRPNPHHELRIWPKLQEGWQACGTESRLHRQAIFEELEGHKFNLYLHGESLNLYRRLGANPRIGDRLQMHEGVHTGNSRKKLFIEGEVNSRCHPVIVGGKELRPFQLRWAGTWLNTDPAALNRDAGDYANLGRAHWHGRDKIVVRRTGDKVVAAFDPTGVYVSNNLFVVSLKDEAESQVSGDYQRAMVALLNSRFMTWYFRAIVPRVGRLFAELKLVHLRDFPLPRASAWQRVERELAQLCEEAEATGAAVVEQVDELVKRAYDFSPAELEVIKLAQ